MAKKILIIDDEPDMITLLKTRLEANNYEIVIALEGEEGLAKVREEKPDLIILDVMMPQMDGFTFIRELKKQEAAKNTPVIVLSAKAMMNDLFKMEGVKDYLTKPYDPAELLRVIKTHLE